MVLSVFICVHLRLIVVLISKRRVDSVWISLNFQRIPLLVRGISRRG